MQVGGAVSIFFLYCRLHEGGCIATSTLQYSIQPTRPPPPPGVPVGELKATFSTGLEELVWKSDDRMACAMGVIRSLSICCFSPRTPTLEDLPKGSVKGFEKAFMSPVSCSLNISCRVGRRRTMLSSGARQGTVPFTYFRACVSRMFEEDPNKTLDLCKYYDELQNGQRLDEVATRRNVPFAERRRTAGPV